MLIRAFPSSQVLLPKPLPTDLPFIFWSFSIHLSSLCSPLPNLPLVSLRSCDIVLSSSYPRCAPGYIHILTTQFTSRCHVIKFLMMWRRRLRRGSESPVVEQGDRGPEEGTGTLSGLQKQEVHAVLPRKTTTNSKRGGHVVGRVTARGAESRRSGGVAGGVAPRVRRWTRGAEPRGGGGGGGSLPGLKKEAREVLPCKTTQLFIYPFPANMFPKCKKWGHVARDCT